MLGVDHATGRLAVIATSNPAATNRGDPAAPDDHLVVFDDQGGLLTNVALSRQGLIDRVGWLDSDRLIVVYSLPTAHVEVIGLDGTVHSSFQPDPDVRSGALSGDRLYLGTPDGIVSTALDGSDPRPFPLSIARVRDVVAIDDGPTAAPQPTPTAPPPTSTPPPPADPGPATETPASVATATDAPDISPAAAADHEDSSGGTASGASAAALIGVAAVIAALICASALAYAKRRNAVAAEH